MDWLDWVRELTQSAGVLYATVYVIKLSNEKKD